MKAKLIILAVLIILIAIAGIFLLLNRNIGGESNEKYCMRDNDCRCGTQIITGECFFGNKQYVNESQQCPDFCSGIAGNFVIKCIDNQCQQIRTE